MSEECARRLYIEGVGRAFVCLLYVVGGEGGAVRPVGVGGLRERGLGGRRGPVVGGLRGRGRERVTHTPAAVQTWKIIKTLHKP